ncbi:MAG: beta-hydroxydecanoyl-ACP dehydratase [Rhodobacterales bacterium CG15_BIG_FIL_POST_REV_8_21_14_020_59_13]|nr:MAG: beta-hydroxydecanoyl-ACP dehydratase [Rhodobacterales bacterium CG15_BIG_FIL_POST_REV_8_21_14_020_59_13]
MTERPSALSYEDLLKSSRGELYGPGNGQLPAPPMLMFDRITHISDEGGEYGKGQVIAELDIKDDIWFFACHFPGDPVMPGCLGLDAMWQLVGFWLVWEGNSGKGRALGCGEVKFVGQVTPDIKTVRYEISMKKIIRRGLVLGVADARLFADDKEIYKAKDLKVGLFKPEDLARQG